MKWLLFSLFIHVAYSHVVQTRHEGDNVELWFATPRSHAMLVHGTKGENDGSQWATVYFLDAIDQNYHRRFTVDQEGNRYKMTITDLSVWDAGMYKIVDSNGVVNDTTIELFVLPPRSYYFECSYIPSSPVS